MTDYIASTGEHFTDDDLERWAQDADKGFPNAIFEPTPPRQWEHEAQPMTSKTFRAPTSLWALVEQKAKEENLTTSDFVRRAITHEILRAR